MRRKLLWAVLFLAFAGILAASLPVEHSATLADATPTIRVQVYNTCFTSKCDSPTSYFETHAAIFGPLFLTGGEAAAAPRKAGIMRERSANLSDVLDMLERHRPDIAILPEILRGIVGERLEQGLRARGFETISYGCMEVFEPPYEICTLIAAREKGTAEPIGLPSTQELGGGGAAALMRIADISVVGVHLSSAYRHPEVRMQQLATLAEMVRQERERGQKVIVAGDFNEGYHDLESHPEFGPLDFSSAQLSTYPSWTLSGLSPLDIDHILYAPAEYDAVQAYTIRGTSDHLAIVMDLARK